MIKVYVSGALTNLPLVRVEFQKQLYESYAKACREIGLEAYVPHLHSDPVIHKDMSPQRVWETDTNIISSCQILIADVTYPSLGVGGEIEVARQFSIPVILLHQDISHISRYALGNPAVCEVISYPNYTGACKALVPALQRVVQDFALS